ncbi:hypothetical protein LWI29_013694 [Acer saccharum]|uniref:Uncharacterized protein n=1 Tax=Acer saccharum TaxID=4024 RepID=A0AA39S8R3_ACESA|nr:hypothetical protein LWI29_013694 [Acer saccharum]
MSPSPGGHVGLTGAESPSGRGAHGPLHSVAKWPHGHTPLSRTLTVSESLVGLLREYNDIFAWSHDEMPGIPLTLATHRLAVDATFKPVKQKRRHFNTKQNALVQEEVDKLLKARFITES